MCIRDRGDSGGGGELTRLLRFYREYVDARDYDGTTALMAGARGGRVAALRTLLAHRADVHARSPHDECALHFACAEGRLAAAALLVACGADACAASRAGATPLDYARRHRCREWEAVAALLVEAPPSAAVQT